MDLEVHERDDGLTSDEQPVTSDEIIVMSDE